MDKCISFRTAAWTACAVVLLGASGCRSIPDVPNSLSASSIEKDRRLNGTVWFQGAESSAIFLQTFALARHALDVELAKPGPPSKPRAVITDIDETVLNNSPYQVWLIQNRELYSTNSWKKWTKRAEAKALPGAREFLRHVDSKGVKIFYVTNRDQDEADATLKNLRAEGFPQADAAHLFCKRKSRSKDDRRDEITRTHTVCLLLGDNLSDFSSVFDSTVLEERGDALTNQITRFGSSWIVFPNPMYGDWEKARPAGATNAIFSVPAK